MEEDLSEKKRKVFSYLKKRPTILLIFILIVLVSLGVYLRTLPMTNPNGLWDVSRNTWTLGPDLDPFIFLRYAKLIISEGSLPQIDTLRYSPLGFDTSRELPMVSYSIVLIYYFINLFGTYSADFAAIILPVIFFALTIIAFFFFVRELFIRDNEWIANLIATISTSLMIVIPAFLSRTVAGIPEKESIAFFFMFLTFYLFLKAWNSENFKVSLILSMLAGISTGLMGLTWGGVNYIYITIGASTLVAFLLNKVHFKEGASYVVWLAFSLIITYLFTARYSLVHFISSIDTGVTTLIFGIILLYGILTSTSLKKPFLKSKLPLNIISVIIVLVFGIISASILFGPSFFLEKAQALDNLFFTPVQGRWVTTVAENRQPYFLEWMGSFGPFVGSIPIMFWLFISGSIVLFYKMLNQFKKKDAWILTSSYILFIFAVIFSRYSSNSIFNGQNFISKGIYYLGGLILIGSFIYYYHKDSNVFKTIRYEYIFLFVLFLLCLVSARGAIRLIMVLAPVATIFVGYLIAESIKSYKKNDSNKQMFLAIACMLVLLTSYTFYSYYNTTKVQSYHFVPNHYTHQWQHAMGWVRDNTPQDSVFVHWWDYGYWVQAMGERTTVTDGGNFFVWWNYLTGRHILTGDNQDTALEVMYSYNVDYLLIDSTDMSKYGAFSQIGSNENFDRVSMGPVSFISEQRSIVETSDSLVRTYYMPVGNGRTAVYPVEEDVSYDGKNLFVGQTGIIGLTIPFDLNTSVPKQPSAVYVFKGIKTEVPMRYVYYDGNFYDFGSGINATAYVIPRVFDEGGLRLDNSGAVIFISSRIMKGLLAQLYILDNSLGNFNNFELVHSEQDSILKQISNYGVPVKEFTYYQGLRGPIKIWEVKYTGNEQVNEEYLRTTVPDYITWRF